VFTGVVDELLVFVPGFLLKSYETIKLNVPFGSGGFPEKMDNRLILM